MPYKRLIDPMDFSSTVGIAYFWNDFLNIGESYNIQIARFTKLDYA
jgi:hypothetical protein